MFTIAFYVALAAPPPPASPEKPGVWFGMTAGTSEYLPVLVLQKKPFAAELKLTPEQEKKIKELRAKLLEQVKNARNRTTETKGFKEVHAEIARERDEAIPPILTDGQYQRFRQLVWQAEEAYFGALGMADNPVVAKAVGFTDDQKKKIEEWAKEHQTAMVDLRKKPDEARAKMKELNEKVVLSLTAAQKAKWNELQGEPFKGPDVILQPGQHPLKFPEPKK